MLLMMALLAAATIFIGLLTNNAKPFAAESNDAGRPTEKDLVDMKKRFYYPSTKMLALAAVLGAAWAVMRALGYEGLPRQICGTWSGFLVGAAFVVKFLENCFDVLGGIFGFGPHRLTELRAHAKIEAHEKKYGYAPAHYIGRLGGDIFGLFWTRKDGSRNRMV